MQFFTTWIWAAGPIWLNLQALAMKGDFAWMPLAVIIGAAAGVSCYMVAMLRHPVWRAVALACAILAASYNVPTAIGSSSEHRRAATEPNRERIERRESLLRRDALLADKIAKIGWRLNGATSFSITAGIEQLKTTPHYIGSDECRNLKKRDPDGICSKLRGEQGRLAEAAQVETFETERETIRQDLLKVDAPATADAQLTTVMQLISPWYQIDGDRLSAILSSIGPIVLELLGTFFPALFGRFWAERNESATWKRLEEDLGSSLQPSEVLPDNLENLLPSIVEEDIEVLPNSSLDADFDRWRGEYLRELEGEASQSSLAYRHYTDWCKQRKSQPLSTIVFSRQMQAAGYDKKKVSGVMMYQNVKLISPHLTVVR